MPLGLRPRAFTCIRVLGLRPASASAGVIGQDRRPRRPEPVLCKDDPAKLSHAGKREDRPLMHTAWTGFTM
eukprot:365028-Chlamydomonas_euryale.AAC.46